MRTDILRFEVVARDLDDDFLEFFWHIPPAADAQERVIPLNEPLFASGLDVVYDEDLIGETLLLEIFDDNPQGTKKTSILWTLEEVRE